MKIQLTFKTPDVVQDAEMYAGEHAPTADELKEILSKFIKYGEYVTIEIETANGGSAKVLPVR